MQQNATLLTGIRVYSMLLDFSSAQRTGELPQTAKALCLRLNVALIYFYKKIFVNTIRRSHGKYLVLNTKDKSFDWFIQPKTNNSTDLTVPNHSPSTYYSANQRELQIIYLLRSKNKLQIRSSFH